MPDLAIAAVISATISTAILTTGQVCCFVVAALTLVWLVKHKKERKGDHISFKIGRIFHFEIKSDQQRMPPDHEPQTSAPHARRTQMKIAQQSNEVET